MPVHKGAFLFFLLWLHGCAGISYYQFGQITWRRVDAGDTQSVFSVEFTVLIGFTSTTTYQVNSTGFTLEGGYFDFGDGTTRNFNETIVHADSTAEVSRYMIRPVFIHNYSQAGPWTVQVKSSMQRWNKILYNTLLNFRLMAIVNMQNNNDYSPETHLPPLLFFIPRETLFYVSGIDKDIENITYRLAAEEEIGPSSKQPLDLAIDPHTGQLTWPATNPSGYWNLQIILVDEENATSVIDLIAFNYDWGSTHPPRPVIGGPNTPLSTPYYAPLPVNTADVFLVDTDLEFVVEATSNLTLTAIKATDPESVVEPVGGLQSTVNGSNITVYNQTFRFRARYSGIQRICFVAEHTVPSNASLTLQSFIYCMDSLFASGPSVDDVWPVPSSIQVSEETVVAWFLGLYLSAGDRVALISTDSESCGNLTYNAGKQVDYVDDPAITRARSIPQYRRTNVTLTAPASRGGAAFCYKLNGGNASGIFLPWKLLPAPYTIVESGPYRVHSLVSEPVNNYPYRIYIDGISLYRLDRILFLQPSVPPPRNSTIKCEGLADTDGYNIKDVRIAEDNSPGSVLTSDQADVPHLANASEAGKYICYKPFSGKWRMIEYLRRPSDEGIYRLVNSTSANNGSISMSVFEGKGLFPNDTWTSVPVQGYADCIGVTTSNRVALTPIGGSTFIVRINITMDTQPGVVRKSICYTHRNITSKVAEVEGDLDYVYTSIPDPKSTTFTPTWVDYSPVAVYINETVQYEFVGYIPFSYNLNDPCVGCQYLWVKVAEHNSCSGTARGGEERPLDRDRRVSFRLQDTGNFRFCIKHRIDWEPVKRLLKVNPKPTFDETSVYLGYQQCQSYLDNLAAEEAPHCGCFIELYQRGLPVVDLPTNQTLGVAYTTQFSINQGCCDNPNSNRSHVGRVPSGAWAYLGEWGYCKHPTHTTEIPYSPYTKDTCN